MKIATSNLQYTSNHKQVQQYQRQEKLQIQMPEQPKQNPSVKNVSLSTDCKDSDPAIEGELKTLIMILEKILGKKIKFLSPDFLKEMEQETGLDLSTSAPDMTVNDVVVNYDLSEKYYEKEQIDLNIQGDIKLDNGKTFSIGFNLTMKREFLQNNEIHLSNGQERKDPLVINFDVRHASFNKQTMSFDIDADGKLDKIATLNPGSGYLAIDRNHDQIINDGSELFGPKSNHGFEELKQYDEDNNQWIDENDSIFSQLQIVTFDENGKQQLYSLKDKAIGAIHLGAMATPFSVKGDNNQDLAQIKQSGIALTESGNIKSIQEVDLYS